MNPIFVSVSSANLQENLRVDRCSWGICITATDLSDESGYDSSTSAVLSYEEALRLRDWLTDVIKLGE